VDPTAPDPRRSPSAIVAVAEHLADTVLLPAALATDTADRLHRGAFDPIAEAGLFGLLVPADLGGLGADLATTTAVIERLASGCLTTAFTWLQHLGPSLAVAFGAAPANALGPDLATGRVRAGVAFAHLRRSRPPLLASTTASRVTLTGTAPWVSGWGIVDVVLVGARDGDDVVWVLLDAVETPTMRAERLALAVAHASSTVRLHFDDHVVATDRVVAREHFASWLERDAAGLRPNGSLALGVTRRCARLLDDHAPAAAPRLWQALDSARSALDAADITALPAARADAAALAVRAAATVTAAIGGDAVKSAGHAARLTREAMFVLVQGQTPARRAALLHDLTEAR
jgi:alkylation response protein AidB-like acyl-CoA dehydrogenase